MPYPNEHSARMRAPGGYVRIRRENDKFGAGIHAIWGVKRDGTVELQAIRFDKSRFTAAEARAWLAAHDHHPISFEPASAPSGQSSSTILRRTPACLQTNLRRETYDGRECLVSPVVLLVEGVHNRVFYPADEMENSAQFWNGVPLPVFHPQRDGEPVSANSPEVIEERSVGRLFNVVYDEASRSLRGEAWIDVLKAASVYPDLVPLLRSGAHVEVSTGLYSADDRTTGEWNGEPYDSIARNFRPDHLAPLPGMQGACSWEDGCGFRLNEGGGTMKRNLTAAVRRVAELLGLAVNEASLDDRREAVRKALDALDNSGWIHFVRDLYQDSVVYDARGNNPSETGTTAPVIKTYRRGYTMDAETGVVTLGTDVHEVREERSWIPIPPTESARPGLATQAREENPTMATSEKIKAAVDKLIACKCTKFAEGDRAWLETLEQDRLDLLVPVEQPAPASPPPASKPAATADPNTLGADSTPGVPPALPPPKPVAPVTVESFLAKAPPDVQATISRALARDKVEKDAIVAALIANERNKFTKQDLDAMPIETLSKMAELGRTEVSYEGAGGGPRSDHRPPAPPVRSAFARPGDKVPAGAAS